MGTVRLSDLVPKLHEEDAPAAAAQSLPSPQRREGRKIGLRAALTGLVLLTVAVTALLIHLTWSYTARQNVSDVAGQLNRQIVASIQHELRATLNQVWSVQEAVRSIFFQDAIRPTDEAKREFIFLALLRSNPALSWIALGFPNGNFFGALRAEDAEFDMVEVKPDPETEVRRRRVDTYTPDEDDVMFRGREFVPSDYDVRPQPWYRRAVDENGPGWSELSHLPNRDRQAIVTSTPIIVDRDFVGVLAVVVEMERLSQFLASLQVGKTGTVIVLDRTGQVLASADPQAIERQRNGEAPRLNELAKSNRLLAPVAGLLQDGKPVLAELKDTLQLQMKGPDGKADFVTFSPLNFSSWIVATVIPESDFLASIERSAMILLAALAVLTLLLAAAAVVAANKLIAAPLLRISGQLKHIEAFRLDRITRLASPLRELDDLSAALIQMSRGLSSFGKYMPTELVRTLVSRGVEARPGGRQETLTVMFTDLAGFTSISERLGDGVVPVLAEYLEAASSAILDRRGTIDKFIGDAVMAFWGAPVPNENHAADACAAALQCQRLLARQRVDAAAAGRTPLRMRIGINTGRMLVGNIGSSERLSYTVIGDPVNVASRLEPLGKRYGVDIIIGEDTRDAAGAAIIVRRLDRVAVYGRMQGLAIYELLAMAEDGALGSPPWVRAYEAGLEAYEGRRWGEAIAFFQDAVTRRGGADGPSELLIARCRTYAIDEPPVNWSSVFVLDMK